MDAVLLDTDVFSFLAKKNHPRAAAYQPHVRGKTVAISFITVGELFYGAQKRGWSAAKVEELEVRLRAVVIVPFDLPVCRAYATISCLKTDTGSDRNLAANDKWIAACAIRHGLTLLSNNRRHFENIPGLPLICEAPPPSTPTDQRLPLADPGRSE